MAIVIDEAFLPATLTSPPMTDEEFSEFCSEHPDLFFEMTAEGVIIIMPPNYTLTGIRNREILAQLDRWAASDGRGITGDASTGFVLPSGARRSPDASWISNTQLAALNPAQVERYWHLCPEFVIELGSHSDRLRTLREKMQEWVANGAQLAWLINPEALSVEVFRADREPETVTADSIAGEGPVAGFVLNLSRVWNPLNNQRL